MTVEELLEKLKGCRPNAKVEFMAYVDRFDSGALIREVVKVDEDVNYPEKPKVFLR